MEQAVFAASATMPEVERVFARLHGGEAPQSVGEVSGVPSRALGQSRFELLILYGSAFAEAVLAIQDDAWHGPIESTLGIHYVRVTAREPSIPQSFDEVRSYAREDVERARLRAAAAGQLEALHCRYEVVIRGRVR